MGAKAAPPAQKLSYFDGRVPQLSAWVNDGTPAADVIGHMCIETYLSASFAQRKSRWFHLGYSIINNIPLTMLGSWEMVRNTS